MENRKDIENYRGYLIVRYKSEDGFRIDFGAKRSKLVRTIEEARRLIDFTFSPDKWNR